jgi:glycine hydroxymethyltransferase
MVKNKKLRIMPMTAEATRATLSEIDPAVSEITAAETERIENTINLIAAENHPPQAVNQAQGSVFTMKAAEGYPGNRYHAGCLQADRLEALAVKRATELFEADHANVQPHSGTSANLAVYFSTLKVGDRILAMKLSHGGHLSHGDAASITSRCFVFRHYGLDPRTELIDYDRLREQALSFRPKMIVAGASSYPRLIDYAILAEIAEAVSAFLLVDMAHIAGLVAAKVIPSPVPYSDFVTFTTYKTLRGGRGGVILSRSGHAGKLEKAIFPGAQGTPSLNMVAAKAVCFQNAMQPDFKKYQHRVLGNAVEFARNFEQLGYRIVSGGTDNHLVLVDLQPKEISGRKAEKVLESVGIVVNRNVIPNDPLPPDVTSGIRIGSPAMTTRGMGKTEVRLIVELIDKALVNSGQESVLDQISGQVKELCRLFPVYSNDRKNSP